MNSGVGLEYDAEGVLDREQLVLEVSGEEGVEALVDCGEDAFRRGDAVDFLDLGRTEIEYAELLESALEIELGR